MARKPKITRGPINVVEAITGTQTGFRPDSTVASVFGPALGQQAQEAVSRRPPALGAEAARGVAPGRREFMRGLKTGSAVKPPIDFPEGAPLIVNKTAQEILEGKMPTVSALQKTRNFFFKGGRFIGGPRGWTWMAIFALPYLTSLGMKFFKIDPHKNTIKDLMYKLQEAQMPSKEEMVRQAKIQVLIGQLPQVAGGAAPPMPPMMTESAAVVPGEQWTGGATGEAAMPADQAAMIRMLQAQGGGG